MFEWALDMIGNLTALVRAAIVLVAIVMVVMVYARTRGQLVATAVAALMAGAVIWAVNNIDWFERKVGEETIAADTPNVALVAHAEPHVPDARAVALVDPAEPQAGRARGGGAA